MISYAQNFEDVMLWRALKHVENGFYIDVGANDPTIDSVTRFFYDNGWNGINIEPVPKYYEELRSQRPRDINIQCAIGAIDGVVDIWDCDVRGWATASESVITTHQDNGHSGEFHKVPMVKLSEICHKHVNRDVHFLKIDVEGFEKQVIDGADFSKFRPWIIVIEATKPNSKSETFSDWESEIIGFNYKMIYKDGLNRFYLASEQENLATFFEYPPNVFDEFVGFAEIDCRRLINHQVASIEELQNKASETDAFYKNLALRAQQLEAQVNDSELRAQQLEAQVNDSELRAQQLEAQVNDSELRAQQLEAQVNDSELMAQQLEGALANCHEQIHQLHNSTSWKLTYFLRLIKSKFLKNE